LNDSDGGLQQHNVCLTRKQRRYLLPHLSRGNVDLSHAVENALLRSGEFTLPGKKALVKSDIIFEVIVMDVTECPVERPKKSKGTTIAKGELQRQKEAPYAKSPGSRRSENRGYSSHGVQRWQNI